MSKHPRKTIHSPHALPSPQGHCSPHHPPPCHSSFQKHAPLPNTWHCSHLPDIPRPRRCPCLHPEAKPGAWPWPGPFLLPQRPQPSHAVICVSMNIRMRTRRAGTAAATIIHGGKGRALPRGGMNHVRLWGEVTESPVGTVSFCVAGRETGVRDPAPRGRSPHCNCSHHALCPQSSDSGETGKNSFRITQTHCASMIW